MPFVGELQNVLFPLFLFTLLATASPGPNNILLAMSGAQYGFRQNIPFVLGIRLGIAMLFVIMGCGVGALVLAVPSAFFFLKLLGAIYLIYLAFKIAFDQGHLNKAVKPRVIGFKQAIVLQFINPKAMLMVLSCITAFSLPGDLYLQSVVQSCLVFNVVGACSNSGWVMFGMAINRLLATEKARQRLNWVLALLTLCAVVLMF